MKHILFTLMLLISTASFAQTNVKLEGNTFKATSVKTESKKSSYTYEDSKGNKYPIYISAKGKAYIVRVSKKTGKQYKQYLPEVTKQLNKK